MEDLAPFLKSLLSVPGISGYESPVLTIIQQRWANLSDEASLSRLGSLHALKRGIGVAPRPSVLISAHMDAVGLMVTKVDSGFLHITNIGGIDPRILPGIPVTVHGRTNLPGVIVAPPARLLPESKAEGATSLELLLVDTGLTPRQLSTRVKIGDLVSFNTPVMEMDQNLICGHSLDNRASVAAITVSLDLLRQTSHAWDVLALASVQEEIGFGGAATSAYKIRPDIAIAVDTTYGKAPGTDGWDSFVLDCGPTLGIGPNIHPYLVERFKQVAENKGIPYALEPMPVSSGTEAMAMQISGEGIPTMVISLPIRYMHTAVEIASHMDILKTGRLLAEFVKTLDDNFLENISWD